MFRAGFRVEDGGQFFCCRRGITRERCTETRVSFRHATDNETPKYTFVAIPDYLHGNLVVSRYSSSSSPFQADAR
jgi:hypothetical protein